MDQKTTTVLENVPDPVVATNERGVIQFASSKIQSISGYGPEELVGQRIELLVPESSRENHRRSRVRFANRPSRREMYARGDLLLRTKKGILVPVTINLNPLELSETTIFVATIRDISDQERRSNENIVLAEITTLVSRERDINVVYELLERELPTLFQFDRFAVSVKIPDSALVERVFVSGTTTPEDGVGSRVARPELSDFNPGPLPGTSLYGESERETSSGMRLAETGLMSWIQVPIGAIPDHEGYVSLRSFKPDAYTQSDLELLERIAKLISPTFDNARLYEQAQREATERTVLAEISRIITSSSDILKVYELVTHEIQKLISFDRIVVSTLDREAQLVVDRYVAGTKYPGAEPGRAFPIDQSMTGKLLKDPKPRWFNDDELDEMGLEPIDVKHPDNEDLRSIVTAPLIWNDEPIGLLILRSLNTDAYGQADATTAMKIASQISGAVANAEVVQNLEQQIKITEVLAGVSKVVTEALDIAAVTPEIAKSLGTLMPIDRLVISDIDETNHRYKLRASWGGSDGNLAIGEWLDLSGTITEEIYQQDRAVLVESERISAIRNVKFAAPADDPNIEMISWIAMPLRTRSRTIGVLHIRSRKPNAYGEAERRIAEMSAERISGGLAAQILYEESRAEADERTALAMIGRIVTGNSDIKQTYEQFAEVLCTIVPADRIILSLLNTGRTRFYNEFVWQNGLIGPLEINDYAVEGAPIQHIMETKTSLLLSPETTHELSSRFIAAKRAIEGGTKSAITAPLITSDEVIGTLHVGSIKHGAYESEHVERLERVAAQISGALATSRLYAQNIESERARLTAESEKRELEALEDQRAHFLSTVSHELKTPLTSLTAFADFLGRNREENLSEKQLEQVSVMRRSARRLDLLIDDLLDISKIDSGRFELNWQEFDLQVLLDEVIAEFEPVITAKSQTIGRLNSNQAINMCGDRNRIAQVISNLLSNASKYSGKETEINLETTHENDNTTISVTDRGIGMNEDDVAKIFTPFFRAANAETQSEAGTGLGLVISKSIIELHGGQIMFSSKKDIGSTVKFDIPDCGADRHPDHTLPPIARINGSA